MSRIHADLERLNRSLAACGDAARYAFLGDLIDALPKASSSDDRGVLISFRDLIDAGDAISVMGNHELNAILYHRTDASGQPLRAHTEKKPRSASKLFGSIWDRHQRSVGLDRLVFSHLAALA